MKSEVKFQVAASDLTAALSVVSILTPRPITPNGKAGYLFVVRDGLCYVYSRDSLRVARAHFPVQEVDGEGSFIYPSEYIKGFQFLQDDVLTFTAVSDGDTHTVKFTSRSGAGSERTSYDPKLMAVCDKDVESAKKERSFPVYVLREAIGVAKPFLSEPQDNRVDEQYKALQIFDDSNESRSKGDGTLYAANGTKALYFYCDAFKGKGLGLHGQHLGPVTSFLAKCEGEVQIKSGQNMTFAVDEKGRVLGWAHHTKTYQKYSYYALKNDTYVFDLPVRAVLSALKYMETELDSKRDKLRLSYVAASNELLFSVVEGDSKATSFPVPVSPREEAATEDFTFSVNLYNMLDLIQGAKGDKIELRVCILPADERRPRAVAMFRTIDEFLLDADGKVVGGSGVETQPEGSFRCRVTRFSPSKD